jgi:hypothetical protein
MRESTWRIKQKLEKLRKFLDLLIEYTLLLSQTLVWMLDLFMLKTKSLLEPTNCSLYQDLLMKARVAEEAVVEEAVEVGEEEALQVVAVVVLQDEEAEEEVLSLAAEDEVLQVGAVVVEDKYSNFAYHHAYLLFIFTIISKFIPCNYKKQIYQWLYYSFAIA